MKLLRIFARSRARRPSLAERRNSDRPIGHNQQFQKGEDKRGVIAFTDRGPNRTRECRTVQDKHHRDVVTRSKHLLGELPIALDLPGPWHAAPDGLWV